MGKSMYFIFDGTVDVIKGGKVVANLSEGQFVGEIALIESVPRTATIKTSTDCCLLILYKEDLDSVLSE
jgi:CRP-like cAMP-binding protein